MGREPVISAAKDTVGRTRSRSANDNGRIRSLTILPAPECNDRVGGEAVFNRRSQPGRKLYACIYLVEARNPAPVLNIPLSAIMITIASPEAVSPLLACTIGR